MLREPLFHFCLIGSCLFALHHWVQPKKQRIVVQPAFVEALRDEARTRTGHLPTAAEQAALIQRFVDEEILYREALALGLDRGDVIVRRRLVQKMEMLASPEEPSSEELERYLRAHAARYRTPPRVTFHHIFVERDLDGVQRALAAGGDWQKLGQPFVAGRSWSRKSESEIAALFGADFARPVMALRAGEWVALRSRFGQHLVRVDEQLGAEPGGVTARVREDWLREKRSGMDQTALAQLRARYTVAIPAN
jgi:peptidyl-prolyl cis-trans isomerase C